MTKRSTMVWLAPLLLASACVSPETHRRVTAANAALQSEIAQLSEHQKNLAAENERLRKATEDLSKRAAEADWIREQKAKLDELLKRYQDGAPAGVSGVDLIQTSEGLAFRVLGGVLFSAGRAEVTEQGQKTLLSLVPTLQQQKKAIRVDGHTDDQPIAKSQWETNLRLAAERAMAVRDFLVKNGVPAENAAIAAYGEYRPAEPGNTEASRAKNRRVEIVMLDR